MAFGFKHIDKPSPHSKALLWDCIAAIAGIVAGFMVTAAFVPKEVSDVVSPILTSLFIPICMVIKRMYSVDVPQKQVPIEQVTEIKDP